MAETVNTLGSSIEASESYSPKVDAQLEATYNKVMSAMDGLQEVTLVDNEKNALSKAVTLGLAQMFGNTQQQVHTLLNGRTNPVGLGLPKQAANDEKIALAA